MQKINVGMAKVTLAAMRSMWCDVYDAMRRGEIPQEGAERKILSAIGEATDLLGKYVRENEETQVYGS